MIDIFSICLVFLDRLRNGRKVVLIGKTGVAAAENILRLFLKHLCIRTDF